MNQFDYENGFYYTCNKNRIEKILFTYEMLKQTSNAKGDIIECGVFKGISLIRTALIRDALHINKKIYGFDTFGRYPNANELDKNHRDKFISEAGEYSIQKEKLYSILKKKQLNDIELVEGDILKTIDDYKDIEISLLIIDVDLYEPTKHILEVFWDRITNGGILVLDDYNTFPGETKAANDFFLDVPICSYLNRYIVKK